MHRRIWPAILVLMVPLIALAVSTPARSWRSGIVERREGRLSRTLARASQFVDVAHVSARPSCEDVQPPEALTTPDPLFAPTARGKKSNSQFHYWNRWARAQPAHPGECGASR